MSHDKEIVINIIDINEAPLDIQLSYSQVAENSVSGVLVGNLTTVDPDNSGQIIQTFTYQLIDDGQGRFEIKGNTLQVKKSSEMCNNKPCILDYEQDKVVNIKVKVTDDGTPPLTLEKVMAISVKDVNDPPVIDIVGNTVPENADADFEIGILKVTDQDRGQNIRLVLLDNTEVFYLKDGKTLVAKQSLDHENQDKYYVSIEATDDGIPSTSSNTTVTIEVLDRNESPSFEGETTLSVPELSPVATVIGQITATDPDNNDVLTLKISSISQEFSLSNVSCDKQAIGGTTCTADLVTLGYLKFLERSVYTVSINVQDEQGSLIEQQYTINVIDVNDPPQDILFGGSEGTSLRIDENTGDVDVAELSALDPDEGQTHTFSLVDKSSVFELQGNMLRVKADAVVDYESQTEYPISVKVEDSGEPRKDFVKNVTVTVNNMNEEILSVTLDNNEVAENSDRDTVIGNLLVEDPDNVVETTQTFKFILVNSADSRFKIENGQIKVAQSNANCLSMGGDLCKLNYESTSQYNVEILVTDTGLVPVKSKTFLLAIELINTNDIPRNLQLSAYKVEESATAGTVIGDLTFEDEDKDQTHTISLVDDNGGLFSVSSTGVVTKATDEALDPSRVYVIKAKITDNGNPEKSTERLFSITVIGETVITLTLTSVGGAVSFDNNKPSVSENSTIDTVIGTIKGEHQDITQDMTFSVEDTENSGVVKFSNSTCVTKDEKRVCTAAVLVGATLDYELLSRYTLVCQVTNTDGKNTVEMFPLSLVDVNEAPTKIGYSEDQPSVIENINGLTLGVFSVEDPDNTDTHTYTLTNDGGGKFTLTQTGQLSIADGANLDYETQPSVDIEVKVTDSGNLSLNQRFTVLVMDVNEIPIKVDLTNNKVLEMSAVGTVVGNLVTEDPDKNQTFTYELTDNADGRFVVEGNVLKVNSKGKGCDTKGNENCLLDFESDTSHSIGVMVTDGGNPPMSKEFTLTVDVDDDNDSPYNLAMKAENLPENLPTGSKVATLTVEDQDIDDTFTYSLTAEAEDTFVIVDNTIKLSKELNYETKSSYTITVQATDSRTDPKQISRDFVLSVMNVNEAPFGLALKSVSGQTPSFQTNRPIIDENKPTETLIGRLIVLDPDVTDTVTFGSTSTKIKLYNQKCIPLTQGIRCTADVRSSESFDFETETSVSLLFYAVDNEGSKISQQTTLTIIDANDAPSDIIVDGTLDIPENSVDVVMATLSATDPDTTQTHSFTMLSGSKFFYIAHNKLKVTSAAELDYETQIKHEITIRVTDNGEPNPLHYDKVFIVTVTDVNEPVSSVRLSNNKISESSKLGDIVGHLIAIDPDNEVGEKQTFTYTITDNADGRFTIKDGNIAVDNADFDFEKERTYTISVTVQDSGTPPLTKDVTFIIEITDDNDSPTGLTLSAESIAENSPLGTAVGTLSAEDEDNGQTLSYLMCKGDFFSVTGNTVVVSGSVDYESTPSVTFQVRVSDDGFPVKSIAKNFTISVTNKNEKPETVKMLETENVKKMEIPECTLINDVLGTLVAFDPDQSDKLTFTFMETGSNIFKLSSTSPDCKQSTQAPYTTECSTDVLLDKIVNYEDPDHRTHRLVVMVKDHLGLQTHQEFVFNIVNCNEPPYDIELDGEVTTIPENSPNFEIGQLESLDDDEDDQHIYQVITFWEIFTVKEGMLIAQFPVDYEKKQSYDVTIKSKDNGVPSQYFIKTFTFNVINVNEAPSAIALSSYDVSNAAGIGDAVGIVTVTDPDNSGITHEQTHNCTVGEEGVGVFIVNNPNLLLKVSGSIPLDKNQMNISITCEDSGKPPLSKTVLVNIQIKETIEVPKIIVLQDQKTVPENEETFTVGQVQIVHQLTMDALTGPFAYLLSDQDIPFKLDGDLLKIKEPLNYEDQSEWEVTVTASGTYNDKSFNLKESFKIQVSDVNETPIKVRVYGGGYIQENSQNGTVIGDLNTEDHEKDQTYSYSLLAVAKGLDISKSDPYIEDAFVLDGRTLKIGSRPELINFEESSVFTIQVKSTDSGEPSLSVTDTINIVLKDVNDPPTDVNLDSSVIAENSPVNTVVGNVIVQDEDKNQKHNCHVQNSVVVPFDITDDLKLIVKKEELDYEETNTYVIDVICRDFGLDGTHLSYQKALIVNVTNINEPPTDIKITNLDVSESQLPGEVVGKVSAMDPESQQLVFSVEGSAVFRIEGQNTIVTSGQLNFEETSEHTITVKVTDEEGLFSSKEFVLKVKDENEAPTGIKLDNNQVEENVEGGTVIGTFSTDDPDQGQTFTYKLLPGDSDGYFAISGNKLVAGQSTLDYETNNEYKILIVSQDNGIPSKSVQEEFTIFVRDLNDPPESIIFGNVSPLDEDTLPKTIVTAIQVDDPDAGQSHSCNLQTKSTPFAIFTNDNAEKSLVLTNVLDFETTKNYNLVVQCSDGEFSIQKNLQIDVNDKNEAPTSIVLSGSQTILADAKVGDLVGQFSTKDPDQNQAHNFVLKGPNSDLFKIDGRKLLVDSAIPTAVLTSANPVITITVRVSDNGDPIQYLQQNLTLLVTNIQVVAAELPSVALDNLDVAEDSDVGTIIGTLYNVNQSVEDNIIFELEKNPGGFFSIKDNKHLVLEKSLADYVGTSVTIVIRVRNVETFEQSSQPVTILIKQVDRCFNDGKTCDENARCVKLNATYHICQCEHGFTGNGYSCLNIDDCTGEDSCQNGATCVDGIDTFSCICPKDFNGLRCENSLQPENPCNKNPCKNNAACISEDGKSYVCNCAPGWTGGTCSDSIDDCQNSVCLAGGQCVDKHRTYICNCPQDRTGPRCQYFASTCNTYTCENNKTDICVPLYNKNNYACGKSVKLTIDTPKNTNLDEPEYKARINDVILELLDRKGISTTTRRRKRRSVDSGEVQVYVESINNNGDGTVTVSFVVLNTNDMAFTKEEVNDMLFKSCTDLESENLSETEVCPAVIGLHTIVPEEKEEGGLSGAVIGGGIGKFYRQLYQKRRKREVYLGQLLEVV
ncbi:protocadherin Fat 4-like isoform X4 [Mytilus californianus]|uniref:protocadherin Fat 4-like isoform X4 n=1 Tax=Mytilus californianus TaxID=6549 RepID=UPI00224568A0|nr:protocadherin Fat 4-like isoform X4 [Mytilus californianus]